jgi:hypothetical protein
VLNVCPQSDHGAAAPEVGHRISHLPPVALSFEYHLDYPDLAPPSLIIGCGWLSKEKVGVG